MHLTLEEAYKILNLSPKATEEEVKKAYKRLALKTHPGLSLQLKILHNLFNSDLSLSRNTDKNPNDPEANKKFLAVISI